MRIAKNIQVHAYKGQTVHVLNEKNIEQWNMAAAAQRRVIFLKLYGFDPEDDKEAQQGLKKYFQ